MNSYRFPLSPKYRDFLKCNAKAEFLEGTTAAGKTTVGAVKFLLRCAESPKSLHVMSGLDLGVIEKNIIYADMGIMDVFGDALEYNGAGSAKCKLPHLILKTGGREKTILLLGYGDKARWKKALGGQYGCLYIDEINIADMEYVREASMRCDYLLATLNPDSPDLDVYREYINHARPLPKYANDGPAELRKMLDQPAKDGWVWWYFSFGDNAALSAEKVEQIKSNVAPGTKLYKNKILGLRGRATGLVFSNFDESRHVISRDPEKKGRYIVGGVSRKLDFVQFSVGLDTSYSSKSDDTIAMVLIGITGDGLMVALDEKTYNNRDIAQPLAPSDTVRNLVDFLDRNKADFGFCRQAFIDSADQATIKEAAKYRRESACVYNFAPAWKKLQIIDRINLQLGWIHKGRFLVMDTCKALIHEMGCYSWQEGRDNTPEDGNDHSINALQYAFIPYINKIGGPQQC